MFLLLISKNNCRRNLIYVRHIFWNIYDNFSNILQIINYLGLIIYKNLLSEYLKSIFYLF